MDMKLALPLIVSTFLISGCGGGGSESGTDSGASVKAEAEVEVDTSASALLGSSINTPKQLLLNRTYSTDNTGTFGYAEFTMPSDGNITFTGGGVNVTIFDPGMNQVGTNPSQFLGFQQDLTAGDYLVEFHFASSNAKHITVYSPQLLPFSELPALENGVYASTTFKAEFYRFSPTTDTTLNHQSSGVDIALYDDSMTLLDPIVHQKESPYDINAGNYVVELTYRSSNTKSASLSSPAM